MSPSSLNLSFLFHFACDTHDVVEAKVNDLPEDTPPAGVFYWLLLGRAPGDCRRLTFRFMKSEEGRQYRSFDQGELCFDEMQAHLQLSSGPVSELSLHVRAVEDLSEELKARARSYIQASSAANSR